jgi:hypothetical protein
LILGALVLGAALRLIENDRPFASSDHAQLAAILTFFYPRNLDMLIPSSTSSWNILTNPHGIFPSVIGLTTMTLLGIGGVTLNEFWWNLPFVLFNLLPIPLAAVLVSRISSRGAGVLAAFLVAILPIHATLSRSCGLNIPVALDFHFLTILSFMHYFQKPTPRRAWLSGVVLAIHLTVEMLFPVLFVFLLGLGILTVNTSKPLFSMQLRRARQLLFAPRAMLLPLLVVGFNLMLMIAYSKGWISSGGLAARLLEGSDRKPGIYFGDFWNNASYVVGRSALPILLILGIAGLPALWQRKPQAVPLLWSLAYLSPFVVFSRPHVYEYFLFGITALTIHAAMVLAGWWQEGGWQRWLASLTTPLLVVLFALRTLSMIFGIDTALAPVVGSGQAPGGVFPDQGLKAAAWWVRSNTPPDTLVFGDSALESYQLWYYLRRPSLGVTDAESAEAAYLLLDEAEQLPDIYLVQPDREALLDKHLPTHPPLLSRVIVEGEPVLLIYGEYPQQVVRDIDASEANQKYDEQFGSWRSMFLIGTRQ